MRDNRYAATEGPPRAARNLDDWTQEGGRADRELDAAMEARDAEEKARRAAIRDVYEVAERVLRPLLGEAVTSVPRRLRQEVLERLAARGMERPTKAQQLEEARHVLAGLKAAEDPETSLAITLAAALLWEPQGGWKAHAPRGPKREGFASLRHLLSSAFEDTTLGVGAIGLEVAQNRARTRSVDGEVFVQASRSSSGRARNASSLDRQIDAQAVVYRSAVDLTLVPLLFERHALGRYATREALLDELQRREARRRRVMLPARPSKGASDAELSAWRLACGVALWGEGADQEQHNRKHDGAMLRAIREAEDALRKGMGIDRAERPARPSRVSGAGYANA